MDENEEKRRKLNRVEWTTRQEEGESASALKADQWINEIVKNDCITNLTIEIPQKGYCVGGKIKWDNCNEKCLMEDWIFPVISIK